MPKNNQEEMMMIPASLLSDVTNILMELPAKTVFTTLRRIEQEVRALRPPEAKVEPGAAPAESASKTTGAPEPAADSTAP